MDSERNYAAFISYRHVSPDKEIAKALQLLLEYNLVRPDRSKPRHIRPVFLDVSEMPTMEDLNEGILDALDHSDYLFVICSPDLQHSKYCMREISYFKEKHGGSLNNIATLLVRGEPQESYPRILRTKTVPDPEDPAKTLTQEVEPLAADVRGKNLLHSLWRLFHSEYLRLAARYFNCPYDALKKRHKRNLIRTLVVSVAALLAVSGLLVMKERQVRETQANTYASYANEQTASGNELLALALCTHTDCAHTEEYTAALRSALVQREVKLRNSPVSLVMEADYSHSALTNYYISASGNLLVVADGNNWQITDAHNGAVIRQFPYESAFVMGQNPKIYVLLDSRPDDKGVFHDYLTVMDLESNQPVAEFPFRESSPDVTDYRVEALAESGYTLNRVTDHGELVAYFTDEGVQLSEQEFVARLLQFRAAPPEADAPYRVVKKKLTQTYVVKDSAGVERMQLGSSFQTYGFSRDWKYLAWVADNVLRVYDTESWSLQGEAVLEGSPQSLHMLPGSGYCVIGFRVKGGLFGDGTLSAVMDWRTGEVFLTTEGTILMSPGGQAFYTVLDGRISGYAYTELDTARESRVIAHYQNISLSEADGQYLLQHTAEEKTLLRFEALEVRIDEKLSRILTRGPESLVCLDSLGTELWNLEEKAAGIALAPDGSRCAWMDDQRTVHVLDAAGGQEIYQIPGTRLEGLGAEVQLVVSGRGLGVLGESGAVWIPEASGEPVSLGLFSRGTLFSDGLAVLQSDARVDDLRIYDTLRDSSFPPFADNTGLWAYSPETGYLVRHIESTGNHPSVYLEVRKRKGQEFVLCGRIDLPENRVSDLSLDSAGQHLSFSSGGRSFVYALEDMKQILNVQGQLYLEAEALYGRTGFGDYRFYMPMHDTVTLLQLAEEALSSPVGRYVLTEEEKQRFSIS